MINFKRITYLAIYHIVINYKGRHVIDNWTNVLFTVCTELVRSPYTKHAASGLHNPSLGGWGQWFVQAQDQQVTTRSPRIVTVYSLARCWLKCLQDIYSQFHAEVFQIVWTWHYSRGESFQSVVLEFRRLVVRSSSPAKHSLVEIGHELISTAILSLPLI